MAIDTYAALQSEMADWLNRADLTLPRGDLGAAIITFISMFESQFNLDPRGRVQDSVVLATADIANELSPVPADYIQMQNIRVPGSTRYPEGLQLLTSQQIGQYKGRYAVANEPRYYAIIGRQLRMLPTPDQQYTFEMEYFAKLPGLSDTNETNWLLQNSPHIYLFGSLLQAEPYLKNDERIGTWQRLYDTAMEALNTTDDRSLFSGAPLQMRTKSFG